MELTRLQRILNLVVLASFLIFTDRASFLRAFWRKSRMSLISLGMVDVLREREGVKGQGHWRDGGGVRRDDGERGRDARRRCVVGERKRSRTASRGDDARS